MLLNNNTQAFTRKEALNSLYECMQDTSEDTTVSIRKSDIEALYKHLLPKAASSVKDNWKWVARAVGKKDPREQFNYMYSDGSNIYATDGHRIHWMPTTLEAGYYCPDSKARVISIIDRFPDVGALTSVCKTFKHCQRTSESATRLSGSDLIAVCVATVGSDPIWVNQAYFLQALNGAKWFNIEHNHNTRDPIMGKSNHGGFVIMPLNL